MDKGGGKRMDKEYIMTIDEGTTGVRVLLFDSNLKVVSQAYRRVNSIYPGPSMVEQDPVDILDKTIEVMREAVTKAGIPAACIAGIGLDVQRGTWMIWDRRTGQPLSRFVVWQDTRGQYEKDVFLQDEAFCARFPVAAASLEKVGSHLATVAHRRIRMDDALRSGMDSGHAAWGNVDSWLIYKLTGGKRHVSGRNIPGSLIYMDIFNAATGGFNEPILEYFYLRPSMMPQLLCNIDDYGTLHPDILGHPVPIMSSNADQQSALFAQGCHEAGMAKCTMGTGTFVDINIGKTCQGVEGLNLMLAWDIDGNRDYMVEGLSMTSGACLEWAKDRLMLFDSFAQADEMAGSVPDSDGVYFVPAINGMDEVPFSSTGGRGSFMGIEASSHRPHFVRALMEGIGFASAYIFETVARRLGGMKRITVDGGVTRSDIVCQLLADLTTAEVVRPKMVEASALGAACMVAIGLGWLSKQDVAGLLEPGSVFNPSENQTVQEHYRMWKKAVERSRDWLE